jgi:hypothetical protein
MRRNHRYGAMIAIGVCALTGFAIVAGIKVASFQTGSPRRVPAQFRESLAAGRWDFYELTGTTSSSSSGPLSFSTTHEHFPGLSSSMIGVTGPGGQMLSVQAQSGNSTQTIRKGAGIYTAVAHVDLPRPGRYVIRVSSDGPARVILARPVLPELEAVLPWAAGAVAGAVLILAGLVLATLGYRRPGLAPPPPGPPAPRAG